MPSAVQIFRALTPSGMIGNFTMMFSRAWRACGPPEHLVAGDRDDLGGNGTGDDFADFKQAVLKSLPSLATRLGW